MIAGAITAVLITVFLGIVVWAYSAERHKDFSQAAQLPLQETHREIGS